MDNFRELLAARTSGRGDLARLARETGFPVQMIVRWRSGDARPSTESLERLAPHLDMTYQELLRMCGYLPGEPAARERVSARQAAIREQLDRWLAAVGPEYEEYFWSFLKSQGESTVALIRRMDEGAKTADNSQVPTADNLPHNAPAGERSENGHGEGQDGGGPITRAKQRRELVGAGAPTMAAALPQAA